MGLRRLGLCLLLLLLLGLLRRLCLRLSCRLLRPPGSSPSSRRAPVVRVVGDIVHHCKHGGISADAQGSRRSLSNDNQSNAGWCILKPSARR